MVGTRTVSTYDAKTHFSQLLSEIEEHDLEVIVTRHDRPIAKIIPFPVMSTPRVPGVLKDQMVVLDGWDEFMEEDERNWYGDNVDWAKLMGRVEESQ